MVRIDVGDGGSGTEAETSTEERREPEDSIRELDSTSESDPMTDLGDTTSVDTGRGGEVTREDASEIRRREADTGGDPVPDTTGDDTGTGGPEPVGGGGGGQELPDRTGEDTGTGGPEPVGGPQPAGQPGGSDSVLPDGTPQGPRGPQGEDHVGAGGTTGPELGDDIVPGATDPTQDSGSTEIGGPDDPLGDASVHIGPGVDVEDVEGQYESETGLQAGEDFTVTLEDGSFVTAYTESYYQREYADEFDQAYPETDIEASDISITETTNEQGESVLQPSLTADAQEQTVVDSVDAQYPRFYLTEDDISITETTNEQGETVLQPSLTEDAAETVTEGTVAAEAGVTVGDIELTDDGTVEPQTDEAAESLAAYSAQEAVPGDAEVVTEEVSPGVYRGIVTSTDSDVQGVAGNLDRFTAVAATPGGERILEDRAEVTMSEGIERIRAVDEQIRERERRQEATQRDFALGRLGDPQEIREEQFDQQVDPQTQIVEQFEDETNLDLDRGDIEFTETTEDGQTVISGELTSGAQKRYRQEQAPGQGTPLEGVFEAGAGLQYEYEQATAPVERTFNRVTPDVPASEDLIGIAASGAPIAAAEPTPAGEAVVAGLVVTGGTLAAAEGLSSRTSSSAGITATEIEIPEDADGQFRDELEISGNAQQFVNEMGVPDRREQAAGPWGIPELGITIEAGQYQAPWNVDEQDVPSETGVFVDEVTMPSDVGDDAGVVRTEQLVRRERRSPTESGDTGGFTGGQRQERTQVPERFIPGEEAVIGEDSPSGGGFPSTPGRVGPGVIQGGGNVIFVGRRPNQDAALEDARDSFFGIDLVDAYESTAFRESAEQASVPGSQAGPLVGVAGPAAVGAGVGAVADDATELGVREDATTDVASDVAAATMATTGPGFASPASTGPAAEPAMEFPETFEAVEFPNEFAEPTVRGPERTRPRIDVPEDDGGEPDDPVSWLTSSRQFEEELVNPLTFTPDDQSDQTNTNDGGGGLFGGLL